MMRRLTPVVLISLLCNADAFAVENPVKSSAEIPRNALFVGCTRRIVTC